MNSSAAPDDPWTPLEEAMLATALRKAERRGRRLSEVESAWLAGFTAGQRRSVLDAIPAKPHYPD